MSAGSIEETDVEDIDYAERFGITLKSSQVAGAGLAPRTINSNVARLGQMECFLLRFCFHDPFTLQVPILCIVFLSFSRSRVVSFAYRNFLIFCSCVLY